MSHSGSAPKTLSFYRLRAGADEINAITAPVLLMELVHTPPAAAEFRTKTHDGSLAPPLATVLNDPQVCVAPLVKSPRNPYTTYIFVGRSSTSDVLVRDPSVSKTHAVFQREADGTWVVRDHKSRNGTWCNGARLEPNQRTPIRNGDAVVFGSYPTYVLLPDEFRATVTRRGASRG